MKSFQTFLIEKTRGEKLGYETKISVNTEISDHLKDAVNIEGTRIKNSFSSFTKLPKLGINPNSEYNTPIGIYAYPNAYVKRKIGTDKHPTALPFAGKSPYVNIFSVKGNILNLSTMKEEDAQKYYDKIIEFIMKEEDDNKGRDEIKKDLDRIIRNSEFEARVKGLVGGRFWYVTMKVAQRLRNHPKRKETADTSVVWNKLFREIGIDGVIDQGKKIIHINEPHQAVFFSKSTIAKNKLVENKYSEREFKKLQGETFMHNVNELRKVYKREGDDGLIKILDEYPQYIKYIKNPSEKVQFFIIERRPASAIKIKNLTDTAKIKLITKRPLFIYNFKNIISDELFIKMLKANPDILKFSGKLPENIQIKAFSMYPDRISDIENPSLKVQKLAINKDVKYIGHIHNIDESMIDYISKKYSEDEIKKGLKKYIFRATKHKIESYLYK